jgi:hypothetical protein
VEVEIGALQHLTSRRGTGAVAGGPIRRCAEVLEHLMHALIRKGSEIAVTACPALHKPLGSNSPLKSHPRSPEATSHLDGGIWLYRAPSQKGVQRGFSGLLYAVLTSIRLRMGQVPKTTEPTSSTEGRLELVSDGAGRFS